MSFYSGQPEQSNSSLTSGDQSTQVDEFNGALYGIVIDLLSQHDHDAVLQRIVDHAAVILDAPFGEIVQVEEDTLVVKAFTRNQPYLVGDRVGRSEGLLSWHALDTRQPAVIDDYSHWEKRRTIYEGTPLYAVANFPIMLGDICLGVLGVARTKPLYTFNAHDIKRGTQFAELVALVLDNASMYDTALLINEELTNARQQADEANQLKSQFLATMSHELRTPLNAIIGYAQLQIAGMIGYVTPEQLGFLDRILSNAQHLLFLINQMLDISKIEAGRMELTQHPFNVRKCLEAVEKQNRVLTDAKSLAFTISVDDRLPLMMMGDEARVRQILINLVSNAVKFTDQGEVSIKARPCSEGKWQLIVSDTGIGIPPHLHEVIFDEFAQAEAGLQRGGTGLGLSITRKLIHMMNGSIRVDSGLGKGSSFIVTLPLIASVASTSSHEG